METTDKRNCCDSHRARRTRPIKLMNSADGVAQFVGCNQRFDLLIAWIDPRPPGVLGGAADRFVVAVVTGNAGGVRRRFDRTFARLGRGAI